MRGVRKAVEQDVAHVPAVAVGVAEIEPRHVAQVARVLHRQRIVEPEALAHLRHLLRRPLRPDDRPRRVGGDEHGQGEGDGGHHQQGQQDGAGAA